ARDGARARGGGAREGGSLNLDELRRTIERLSAQDPPPRVEARAAVEALLAALERGEVRAAEPRGDRWEANAWVKQGILLGFRTAGNVSIDVPPVFHFRDREPFATSSPPSRDVRIVPGGSVVRRGAFVGDGVVIMPPAFVNVSAAAQIGGVLEPVGALPVVIEDGVLVGGGCGVYEGTIVRKDAILAAGVVLT